MARTNRDYFNRIFNSFALKREQVKKGVEKFVTNINNFEDCTPFIGQFRFEGYIWDYCLEWTIFVDVDDITNGRLRLILPNDGFFYTKNGVKDEDGISSQEMYHNVDNWVTLTQDQLDFFPGIRDFLLYLHYKFNLNDKECTYQAVYNHVYRRFDFILEFDVDDSKKISLEVNFENKVPNCSETTKQYKPKRRYQATDNIASFAIDQKVAADFKDLNPAGVSLF